jgi:hypothetical protein
MTIQSHLEEALENLPIATASDDSMEASLLAQANALLLLFKHLSQSALQEPGSPAAERRLRLAVRAQAESGRIMQRLIGLRKAADRAGAASQDEAHRNHASVIGEFLKDSRERLEFLKQAVSPPESRSSVPDVPEAAVPAQRLASAKRPPSAVPHPAGLHLTFDKNASPVAAALHAPVTGTALSPPPPLAGLREPPAKP